MMSLKPFHKKARRKASFTALSYINLEKNRQKCNKAKSPNQIVGFVHRGSGILPPLTIGVKNKSALSTSFRSFRRCFRCCNKETDTFDKAIQLTLLYRLFACADKSWLRLW